MKLSKVCDIFHVSYGTKLDMNKMRVSENANIAFISRSSRNNGFVAYVDQIEKVPPLNEGLITVSLGGTYVLSSFLQDKPFYTAQNVAVLSPKVTLTTEEKLYYCYCISQNRFRYSAFGREANRTLKELIIPATDSIPDYVNKVDQTQIDNIKSPYIIDPTPDLHVNTWHTFRLGDLFDVRKGKRLTKINSTVGQTPFIGAIDKNNGYRQFIGQEPIHEGNTITVNYNGSVAEAFFQPKAFWASDDVNVLYPKFEMNQYNALFLITVIKKEKYRFNYGRKWHLERMRDAEIRLPAKEADLPDFDFMEKYMKTLEYSKQI